MNILDLSNPSLISFAPKSIEEEIQQNLFNIFKLRRNQVPYQRDIGLDGNLIDEKAETVKMMFQLDMTDQVSRFEPRVKILRFDWGNVTIDGNLEPKIIFKIIGR